MFDGHGGSSVSEYLKERFPEVLKDKILEDNPSDLVSTLEEVFLKIDNEIKLIDSDQCGSTA